eukprot:c12414_g1_i1 orf=138-1862(+)
MGSCLSKTGGGGTQAVGGLSDHNFEGEDAADAVHALTRNSNLSSQIELSVSASDLRDRDIMSKSDPMVVCYQKAKEGTLEELGRTEVILNSLNPIWVSKLKVLYSFEEVQILLFRVYDVDTSFGNVLAKDIPLQHQQFLGETECVLSQIVTAPGQKLTRALQPQREKTMQMSGMPELGSLTVRAEEMLHSKLIVEIKVFCTDLDNKDLFSKSDPFCTVSKMTEDGSFIPVYKSEVKNNDLNPVWKPFKVTMQQLCNGDKDCPLRFECYNFNGSGRHDLIGAVRTSLNALEESVVDRDQIILNLERQSVGHSATKVGGKIHFQQCSILNRASFLDYIFAGFELNFLVAVDFTASNGNPFDPDSLHFIDPSGRPNAYQAAISSIGEVLEYYDSDKRFTVWGFGGRPNQSQPVSHCFNLNRYSQEVVGVRGILEAYSEALRYVRLGGPTIFGPVINQAASLASQVMARKYCVLLILTDGVITDLQESVNALVNASGLPLSILIVGIGGANFTEMEFLDADKGRLQSSDKRFAVRDIVQFVPLRDSTGPVSLARMLLAELPTQFLDYMQSKGIFPNSL